MSTNHTKNVARGSTRTLDKKVITWQNKRFVQDRVTSLFHIPLNYGAVMARLEKAARAAGARTEERIILTDENSLWGRISIMK